MASSMFERVGETFKLTLNDTQKTVIKHLLKKQDVLLSIKTGGGKSLCYQAFPTAYKYNDMASDSDSQCKVFIISPLLSIMREQTEFLRSLGFTSNYIGESVETDECIAQGQVQFVFSSPESAVGNEKWRSMLINTSSAFRLTVVDEAHTVIHW